jgi:hypothetical protein
VSADASVTVLEDDLQIASGWIAGVPGDTATQGTWQRIDPIGTDAQPEVDHTSGPGTECFVTGQGPQFGNIGDADVDEGVTTLLSPLLDLSGTGQATIAYWRWYHNSYSQLDADEGLGPNEDVLTVWITDDGGATWTLVESVGPTGPETSGGWILHAFDAGALVDLTDQVRLRFVASDVGNFSIVEAAVDDLLVVAVDCVWTDLGQALPGTAGSPELVGEGPLEAGSPLAITLQSARPNAVAWLCFGLGTVYAPFFGGVFVPDIDPPGFALPLLTDGGGELAIADNWPPGVPSDFSIFLQYWIEDPAGPLGFAASNAIQGTTP